MLCDKLDNSFINLFDLKIMGNNISSDEEQTHIEALSKDQFISIVKLFNTDYDIKRYTTPKFKDNRVKNGYFNDYCFLNKSLKYANINSKDEIALFLAHIMHETNGLKYMVEQNLEDKSKYNCKENGEEWERKWAKHNVPGQYYYGRGCLQLSWTFNYYQASMDLDFYKDDTLLKNPDFVSKDRYLSWITAAWFWKVRVKQGLKDI